MLLADFGADVIRVERPGGGEDRAVTPVTESGEGSVFLQGNRNKRSLTLDVRAEGGEGVRRRLIETADVVITNVPDGSLAKMGLDHASLCAIRPDVVSVNTSSFGPVGPWVDRPGFDSVGQAMCGSAFLSGPGDVPYRSPITWVDHATALFAAYGVMVALFERTRTGRGQAVSGSLLGSALALSSSYLIEQAVLQKDRVAIGNRGFVNGPTDTFRTRDGWIVTQVVGSGIFERWVRLIEEPHWLEDPRFASDELRGDHGAVLSERMARWCADRTSDDALVALAAASIPAGPVLSPRAALDHPQVRAIGLMEPVDVFGASAAIPLARTPVTLSETPGSIRTRPPRPGEHSREILAELGLSGVEIDRLVASGAVSEPTEPFESDVPDGR